MTFPFAEPIYKAMAAAMENVPATGTIDLEAWIRAKQAAQPAQWVLIAPDGKVYTGDTPWQAATNTGLNPYAR